MATLKPKLSFPSKAIFSETCSGCQAYRLSPIQSLALEVGVGLFFEVSGDSCMFKVE